jgi:hypothetical protein
VRLAVSSQADKLAANSELLAAKPLVEFKLTADGGLDLGDLSSWKSLRLTSVEGSLLFGKQKTLWSTETPGSTKPDTANLRRQASSNLQVPVLTPATGSTGKGGPQGPRRPKQRPKLPVAWTNK